MFSLILWSSSRKLKAMKHILIFALVIAWSIGASAQKIILETGNASVLKGEKSINLVYDYSSFGVGKFATEKEYLDKKTEEYNKEEPGRGDKFKDSWFAARENRYQPKFEELINSHSAKKGMVYGKFPDAKYTLKVKTTFVEIGFNVGVMKRPAAVSFQYIIYETANPGKIVASFKQNNVPGSQAMGYDYDVGSRVAESYAKGGKMLAKVLSK